jgi:hypothetical protein
LYRKEASDERPRPDPAPKVAKAPQLRPHDIALDWRALTPQGLPAHLELRPWHVIQIVRQLDEGLTNAFAHRPCLAMNIIARRLRREATA